jgi:hypothetical protein
MALVPATRSPSLTKVWLWRVAHITSSTMLKAAREALFTESRPSVSAKRFIFPSLGPSFQMTLSPAKAVAMITAASFSWISSSDKSMT